MRNVTIKIYKFEELSDKAKEKAIEDFRDDDIYGSILPEMLEEDFIYKLKEYGYHNIDGIYYSLSCCQGDGVSFEGDISTEDVIRVLDRLLNKESKQYQQYIKILNTGRLKFWVKRNTHHYYHEKTMSVSSELDCTGYKGYTKVSTAIENLTNLLTEDLRDIAKECENQGYKTIDYHYSLERIQDFCDCNESEFLEDGKPY